MRSSRVEFTSHCTYVWYSVRFLISPFPLLSRHGFMCGSSRTLESWNQVQASQFKESRLSSWREWIRPPTLQPRVWVVENFFLQPSQCDGVFKIFNPYRSRNSSLNSTTDKTVSYTLFGVATNHVLFSPSNNIDAMPLIYRCYFEHLLKFPAFLIGILSRTLSMVPVRQTVSNISLSLSEPMRWLHSQVDYW